MTARRRRTLVITMLVALALTASFVAACSANASDGASGDGASATAAAGTSSEGATAVPAETAPAEAAAAGARGAASDWTRVLAALAFMRAEVPTKPVVVLLGGSAARESTISDKSWREQIVAKGGPETLAWNLGSRNRTLAQNVAIVRALPQGIDAIVYIGVNLGAFTSTQTSASISLPSPAPTAVSLQQPHQHSIRTGILTYTQKRALVRHWLTKRYPVYKAGFPTSAGVLEKLIQACKQRGYKPVLLELPRNTAVIGTSLTTPRRRYRDTCAALSKKYGVPWVSLVSAAKLPSRGFYDLWHLVEPGRTVWQDLLSVRTVTLLERYGYGTGGS